MTVAGIFQIFTSGSVEWFLAGRYLRQQGRRPKTTLIVGLVMALISVGLLVAAHFYGVSVDELGFDLQVAQIKRVAQGIALGLGILAYIVVFFGVLLYFFSLFTSISIFGVFLGTAALVIVLSVMGGFESDLRRKILGTTSHAVVTRPHKMFTGYRELLKQISSMPDVHAVTPYLEGEVMITSQTNLSGVLLRGIDPRTIHRVTKLPSYLKAPGGAGRLDYLIHPEKLAKIPEARFRPLVTGPLGKDEPGQGKADMEDELLDVEGEVGKEVQPRTVYPGVVIGAELAKNLRLYVGDDVNVVAPLGGMSPMGPVPKSKPFRVAGIFFSGMYEYDTKFAYITIPAAQRFLGIGDEITGLEVKAKDIEQATPLADEIRRMLKGKSYQVKDWKEINRNLFSALKLERVVMFIVLIFIVLVASFSIITTLTMLVLQKRREIAALKSMGASNRSVLMIFLASGLYIGVIGMLVGMLTGVSFCLFLLYVGLPLDPEVYYISVLPVQMNVRDISLVALASVTLSFLATIYPSLLAANLKPVDGLRRYVG